MAITNYKDGQKGKVWLTVELSRVYFRLQMGNSGGKKSNKVHVEQEKSAVSSTEASEHMQGSILLY